MVDGLLRAEGAAAAEPRDVYKAARVVSEKNTVFLSWRVHVNKHTHACLHGAYRKKIWNGRCRKKTGRGNRGVHR